MKINNFYLLLLVVAVVSVFSCHDAPVGDSFAEDNYAARGTLVIPSNTQGCFFEDPTASLVTFDLDTKGEGVTSAEVFATYNDFDEVSLGTVTTFPSTFTVDMVELVATLGVTATVGDEILISFAAQNGSGTFRSNRLLPFNVGCTSTLAGSHPFVATNLSAVTGNCPTDPVEGVVTFTEVGCGVYACSDMGFGQYETTCWNDTPATNGAASFDDICNSLNVYGLDQYNLTYAWDIVSVDGPVMTIDWTNNYNDSGTAVITKEDGTDWPDLVVQ